MYGASVWYPGHHFQSPLTGGDNLLEVDTSLTGQKCLWQRRPANNLFPADVKSLAKAIANTSKQAFHVHNFSMFITIAAAILSAILDLHALYVIKMHSIMLLGYQNLYLDAKSMFISR